MIRRLLIALIGLGLVCALPAAAGAASKGAHAPRTPIKHFIVLMQENHTYDNYFGTYPRGDRLPSGVCMLKHLGRPKAGCVKPFWIGGRAITDLPHSPLTYRTQFNGGRMNGFVAAFNLVGLSGTTAMGHYDARDLPFYWNVADQYVLFDRFFSSGGTGSFANHMWWVTATSGGTTKSDSVPTTGYDKLPMIFDRLEKAGVSWKFYVQNYDPKINFRNRPASDRGSQVIWVPPLVYPRYLKNPKLFSHIVDLSQYYKDLDAGTLPEVAYIAPSGASEHPPGSVEAGQVFVRTLINSLMASPYWPKSAFMWAYDDWGGWYDHVKPPQIDKYGYGFRVPALLVSPYARRGYIDSTTLDFTSILKFIEQNWNLKPLAVRDARAKSFVGAFDFSQAPRAAAFVPAVRNITPPVTPNRSIVYPSYILAFLLTAALIVVAVHRSRTGRRPDLPTPPGPPEGGQPLRPATSQRVTPQASPASPTPPRFPPRRDR